MSENTDISIRIKSWRSGDGNAINDLTPVIYDELRRIAAQYLRKERKDHTLQPTELAHEAFLKLIDIGEVDWQGRAHFFAVAAQVIRHLLVDHARARAADKRGGGAEKIELTDGLVVTEGPSVELLALHDALTKLESFDSQQSTIIELRFFGGLTIEETSTVLDISPATVKREWALARAWLSKEISSKAK